MSPADPTDLPRRGRVRSVNVGAATPTRHSRKGVTGLGKHPADGPVAVTDPGPKGTAGSGLAGDDVCDRRHHGGTDQAVYAYAREDLDAWQDELGRALPDGCFGENLTTEGLDLTHAVVGEIWSVGSDLLLQVTVPRVPCRTFAGALGERGWVRRFTERGATGSYLRVLRPGSVRAGDPVEVVERPDHGVSLLTAFRAVTTAPELLCELAVVPTLGAETRELVVRRTTVPLDPDELDDAPAARP